MGKAAANFILEASRGRRYFFLRIAPLLIAVMLFSSAKGGTYRGEWDRPYDLLAYVTTTLLVLSAAAPGSMRIRLLAASFTAAAWISRFLIYVVDSPVEGWTRVYVMSIYAWLTVSSVAWAFAADLTLMVVNPSRVVEEGSSRIETQRES